MPTLAEIEEALDHLRAVPAEERGAAWHAYCDSLLEQRDERLQHRPAVEHAGRETRVMFSAETR